MKFSMKTDKQEETRSLALLRCNKICLPAPLERAKAVFKVWVALLFITSIRFYFHQATLEPKLTKKKSKTKFIPRVICALKGCSLKQKCVYLTQWERCHRYVAASSDNSAILCLATHKPEDIWFKCRNEWLTLWKNIPLRVVYIMLKLSLLWLTKVFTPVHIFLHFLAIQ